MKIKVGSDWKEGVPHVNVGGIWKKAVATWINVNGTWKKQEYTPPTKPVLVSSPQSTTEATGLYYTFTASFSGVVDTLQWYRNGVAIPGENTDTLFFLAKPADNGAVYKCRATNSAGFTDSDEATLTLRRRIYMNWDITIPFLWSTGKVRLRFNDDGTIRYYSDVANSTETWISGVNEANLGTFDMSQYQVKLLTSKGEAVVDSTSNISYSFVDMYDGIELVLDISACPIETSRTFSVEVIDKVLPDYNWAGWNSEVLYYKREEGAKAPIITKQPQNLAKFPTELAEFILEASENGTNI